ncbi:alpha/beta-hydrolase [Penicillium malachiteum]|uniref:Alpha/beta-hydrolase n=1 Tax=Penicillium malachiteum TaxID=1324776 RepID=A0AAD6MZH3_9EURO|nr:alpha/beta-hydrolase [Penicillium malachiteum]
MARFFIIAAILAWATSVLGLSEPGYYANLTWEKPRTLSNWANLTVETPSGTFIGFLNDTYPNVRQFLRVPYAQYVSSTSTMWSEYEPTNLLINLGEIWTPAYANKTSKLPVALFCYWRRWCDWWNRCPISDAATVDFAVSRTHCYHNQLPGQYLWQYVIWAQVSCLKILMKLPDPKSRALNETSLSLLDVRAATEWVYENIELFGGDPENIMLWGQSQGAALTHLYTIVFPDEPLASHFSVISRPTSVTLDVTDAEDVYEDFDIVAKALGCNYGDDAEAELNCMRGISWVQIEEFINRYSGLPSISFSDYIPDERYTFSNESKRYLEGKIAKGPGIRSDTERESASTNLTSTAEAEVEWDCVAALDTTRRYALGLDTYRYYWGGKFTNISPVSWLGAFHWSDLLMIFGTYSKQVGPISQLEIDTSITMQDFILAFLKDPASVSGLGWDLFDPHDANGGQILEFGKGNPVHNITGDYLDAPCWNSSLKGRING